MSDDLKVSFNIFNTQTQLQNCFTLNKITSEIALFNAKMREICFQLGYKDYKLLSDYRLGDLSKGASLQSPVVQKVNNAVLVDKLLSC